MSLKAKNIDTLSHHWGGKTYEVGEIYTLQTRKECVDLGIDDRFLCATQGVSPIAEFYQDDTKITSIGAIYTLLLGIAQFIPTDDENKPVFRTSMTHADWHYGPRSLDFYTAKAGSLYNREHDNAGIDDSPDIGDAVLRFYERGEYGEAVEMEQEEGESSEAFQTRLSTYCVKTVCEFEHTLGVDIWGAKWMFSHAPQDRAYLWVVAAPDIPKAYGGNVAFMGGGMALHMMEPKKVVIFDAKTTKLMSYDPTYHSGKLAIVLKHSAGEQIGVQLIFDFYEE